MADLNMCIVDWEHCNQACPTDVNQDGSVNILDMNAVVNAITCQ